MFEVNKIAEKVRKDLEGKSDVVKRMVLKQLLKLIDMRQRSDYMEVVIHTLQVPDGFTKISEGEALILKCEMTNVACSFSLISDQEIESLNSALKDELAKCSPQGADSLEELMRERLADKLRNCEEDSLDGTPQGVILAGNASFNDEEFVLSPITPILWDELRKIIVEYYESHGFDEIKDGKLGESIYARKTGDDPRPFSQTYCTIGDDMIIVSRKNFRC